jgi:hypothetical protein
LNVCDELVDYNMMDWSVICNLIWVYLLWVFKNLGWFENLSLLRLVIGNLESQSTGFSKPVGLLDFGPPVGVLYFGRPVGIFRSIGFSWIVLIDQLDWTNKPADLTMRLDNSFRLSQFSFCLGSIRQTDSSL